MSDGGNSKPSLRNPEKLSRIKGGLVLDERQVARGTAVETMSRRSLIYGIGASSLLAACGKSGGDSTPITVAPTPSPTPAPTATPAPTQSAPLTVAAKPLDAPVSILTTGMSVFLGADIVGGNYPDRDTFMRDHAPVRYFVSRLQTLRGSGAAAVTERNVAVGGSFDNDVAGQYAGAAGTAYDLVFLGLAMNSGSAYGVHGRGPNAGLTYGILKDALAKMKADGARPLICNTIHPWPDKITPASIENSLVEGVAWPPETATLYNLTNLRFDTSASQITCLDDAFSTGPGRYLTAGSQLKILANGGGNTGKIFSIAQRSSPTTLQVAPGQIVEGGDFALYAQHYAPDLEPVLVPPPSQQNQTLDWVGLGTATAGLSDYRLWNGMLQRLAQETDTLLLDLEYRGFQWVSMNGWASIYTSTYQGVEFDTFNHPQFAAQSVIYGGLMSYVAELYAEGSLPAGYAQLRGPAI